MTAGSNTKEIFGNFINPMTAISNFITSVLNSIREFLNGINNTIWGLLIIFVCMRMIAKEINVEAAYYFAGVGSTMIGIKASQPIAPPIASLVTHTESTSSTIPPIAKVE